MNLVDVHAHLDLIDSDEINAVMARAESKGVKAVITNSVNSESGKKALELQKRFAIVRAALGIYPAFAANMNDDELERGLQFIRDNNDKTAAIGEVGLDYQETKDREKQQKAFELQLEMGKKFGVPVLVHSRKAEKEVIDTIISNSYDKIILHAFHGNMKLVKTAADAGIGFSIPSNVVRSEHFQKMAEVVPLENLFAETDTPYLGPEKNGYSEPAYVELSVKKIAEIKKIKAEEAAQQIYRNTKKMFKTIL